MRSLSDLLKIKQWVRVSGIWVQAIWPQGLGPLPVLDSSKVAIRFALGNIKANRSSWLCWGDAPWVSWKGPAAEGAMPGELEHPGPASHYAAPSPCAEGQRPPALGSTARGGHRALFFHVCQFHSSVYLWIDSPKDLELHQENASTSRAAVSPCRLGVEFHCY